MEPTIVFLAQPLTCSGPDPGPGTADIESTAMAQPCPPGSHRLAGERDRETDCSNKGSTKAPTPCPRPRPLIPTHGLPPSRARKISPGRRRSLPRKVEAEAVFAQSSQPSLPVGLLPIHSARGCHFSAPAFQIRPLRSSEPLLGSASRGPSSAYTATDKALCAWGGGWGGCVFPQHRAHLDGPAPQTGGKVRMP